MSNTRGIVVDEQLIGFTMYGISRDLHRPELCRFMIDYRYQGKGLGKAALRLIAQTMFTAYDCEYVYLSTNSENYRGIHVYEQLGFIPTGERFGGGDDIEDMYVLSKEKFYENNGL